MAVLLAGCSGEPAVAPTPAPTAVQVPEAGPTTMADFPAAPPGGGGPGGGGSAAAGAPRIPSEWRPHDPRDPATFDKTHNHLPGFAEAVTARNPVPATPGTLKRGAALWKANCAPCHGAEGRGDGPSAALLREPLRDLTNVWLYKYGASDQALFRSIAFGFPGSAMGVFKGVLKDEDLWSLVVYTKSLQKP